MAQGDKELLDLDENRVMAALSYVGVLVFVPLLTRKNNPYVVWHVKQGLVILIGFVISMLAGWWISGVGSALFLVLLIVDVIALSQTLMGRSWRIPIIAKIADSFRI